MLRTRNNNNRANPRRRRNVRRDNTLTGGTIPNQRYASGAPPSLQIKFVWYGSFKQTTTTGCVDQIFNLNSLFDPDRTGGTVQPENYPQWINLYSKYRVDKCVVKVRTGGVVSSSSSVSLALLPSTSVIAFTTVAQFSSIVAAPLGQSMPCITGGASKTLTTDVDLARLAGVTRTRYNSEENYAANSNSSPTETLACHVAVRDGGLGAGSTIVFDVTIEYYSTLFDRLFNEMV